MKESETVEFKKSLAELSDGLNSIAAILNKHSAGELWFGIKNDGNPAGMDVSETTLRKVSQAIAAHIEPKIYPDVSTVVLSGKSCVCVAFSGSEKPYYAHGRAYMRVADEDRQLSAKEIESIILRKNRSHRSWDAEPILDPFKPDAAKIRVYVRKAGLPWTNAHSALESLGLHAGIGIDGGVRIICIAGFGDYEMVRRNKAREIVDMAVGMIVGEAIAQPQQPVDAKILLQFYFNGMLIQRRIAVWV